MIKIVPTTLKHVVKLSNTLSLTDRQELDLLGIKDVKRHLILGFKLSEMCFTSIDENNNVLAIAGIKGVNILTGSAIIWMLHAEGFGTKEAVSLGRYTKKVLATFKEKYALLYNYVWANNKNVVQWLSWLGCEFAEIYQVKDEQFIKFLFKTNKEV